MSGFERYLRILRLFGEARGSWTVAELSDALETSASTLYRLVREMVAAGFLESTVEARYRLGPAFVDYERRIRLTDPLVRAGDAVLGDLVKQVGVPCTAVLARLYGATVMCVADARAPDLDLQSSFERGRPMPLTRGATSRAILAGIETRRLRRLLRSDPGLAAADCETLLANLAGIRRIGLSVTHGEVDLGAIGMAAPVRNRRLGIQASLSVVMAERICPEPVQRKVAALLAANSGLIEAFLNDMAGTEAQDDGIPAIR